MSCEYLLLIRRLSVCTCEWATLNVHFFVFQVETIVHSNNHNHIISMNELHCINEYIRPKHIYNSNSSRQNKPNQIWKVCTRQLFYLFNYFSMSIQRFNFISIFFYADRFIHLNIRRLQSNKKICSYPSCTVRRKLKHIPKYIRFVILFDQKVYIPFGNTACSVHSASECWLNVSAEDIEESNDFNANFIEDMFALLTDKTMFKKSSESLRKSRVSQNLQLNHLHVNVF